MILEYMNGNKISTRITVDYEKNKIEIENFTDDIIARAFGVNENPTMKDFECFLESRCFPKSRDHLKWILNEMGINCYDPLLICKKTKGVMAEDDMWINFMED